jgi:hypothetical protein
MGVSTSFVFFDYGTWNSNHKGGSPMGRVVFGVVAAILSLGALPALADNCGVDFQHAYETGVSDGRADAANGYDKRAMRHRPHLDRESDRGKCYVKGYRIGYENAAADAENQPAHGNAPTPGSNERAYYDDGCLEGTRDAKASMSMAYERHADMYDSRFEPYFAQGYEECWKHFR